MMGCWSKYCGVSNITINGGTKCVLLPVKKDTNNVLTGLCEYIPASLPIFGTYNNYGDLENIVKDNNTNFIETITNKPINEVASHVIGQIKDDELVEYLDYNSYMLIDFSIYNKLIEKSFSEYIDLLPVTNVTFLEEIRFTIIEKENSKITLKYSEIDELFYIKSHEFIYEGKRIYDIEELNKIVKIPDKFLNIPKYKLWNYCISKKEIPFDCQLSKKYNALLNFGELDDTIFWILGFKYTTSSWLYDIPDFMNKTKEDFEKDCENDDETVKYYSINTN